MTPNTHVTEHHILAVLAGTPQDQVAAQVPMDSADLADAVEAYRAAGRTALEAQTRDWYQVRIQFTDWNTAEQAVATLLAPALQHAQDTGDLAEWWFLRKHPCWRLRCRPNPKATGADTKATVRGLLDHLTTDGAISRWWESLYEPESLTFGGVEGMALAHGLFHADSRGTLDYLRRHGPAARPDRAVGRRELSLLLCTAMFRGARQDNHEQGDIWHRVVRQRPLPKEPPQDQLLGMAPGVKRLINLDTSPAATLFAADGPLPFAAPWAESFATAGHGLANAARNGTLHRGLRDILATHVIFHWNRLGLPADTQAILARAAREALMNPTADYTRD